MACGHAPAPARISVHVTDPSLTFLDTLREGTEQGVHAVLNQGPRVSGHGLESRSPHPRFDDRDRRIPSPRVRNSVTH